MLRAEAVDELKRVYSVLSADLEAALEIGRKDPSQFAHRTLLRTYFAFVEGIAYQLRQVTVASLDESGLLSSGELALLHEERFQLNAKGVPEPKENFQPMLPNLLFSISCYVKNHGAVYSPDTKHQGWEAMKRAVAVRNRITHPRSAHGLQITDEESRQFARAAAWWQSTLLAMFRACGDADEFFQSL